MRRGQKGFTLIELLVVIAILGILAAVAIPRILGAMDSGRRSANITNAATIQSAVARFNVDNDTWPTLAGGGGAVAGALPTGGNTSPISEANLATYLQGGRLPAIRAVIMHSGGSELARTIPATGAAWHINVDGQVVIVHDEHIWNPANPATN